MENEIIWHLGTQIIYRHLVYQDVNFILNAYSLRQSIRLQKSLQISDEERVDTEIQNHHLR